MSNFAYTLVLNDGSEFSGDQDTIVEWAREGRVPSGTKIRLESGETVDSDTLDWIVQARQRRVPPQRREDIHRPEVAPNAMEHVIPARNLPALLAWYFGVFSIIPCMGGVLGIMAIVFGIMGLRLSRKPEIAVGFWHALIGMALGILTTIVWLILGIFIIYGMVNTAANAPKYFPI